MSFHVTLPSPARPKPQTQNPFPPPKPPPSPPPTTSTPIPATLSNLAALQAQADFASGMVHHHLKKWLALHRRLFLLKQCARQSIYAELPLCGNMAALQHCVCKPLRASLQAVIAVQRGLAMAEKEMREWVRKEKGLHQKFGEVAAVLELERMLEWERQQQQQEQKEED